jgi:hypothetical protein
MKRLCRWAAWLTVSVGAPALADGWLPSRELEFYPSAAFQALQDWDLTSTERQLVLRCTACEYPAEIRIEILSPYVTSDSSASPQSKYLALRKKYCSDLAVENTGRCVGTDEAALFGHPTYVSMSEHDAKLLRYEEVLFLWDAAIVGVVVGAKGTERTETSIGVMRSTLLWITPFW